MQKLQLTSHEERLIAVKALCDPRFGYGISSERSRSTTGNHWWAILDSNQEPMD
jgi:predicted branched-subunit amino acid permease